MTARAKAGRHHAIIGDGATAAAFAANARLGPGDVLTLIGPGCATGTFGRGLAYGDPGEGSVRRDAYLLNSPAEAVEPSFVPWVEDNWSRVRARLAALPGWSEANRERLEAMDIAAMFLPRSLFGDFLVERAETGLARLAAEGVRVRRRATTAEDLGAAGDKFAIRLSNGERILADTVDVATGAPPLGGRQGWPLHGNEDRIGAWLSPGCRIVCIGANATMLDLLRLVLCHLEADGIDLTILSTSGHLPEALVWTRPRTPPVTPALSGPFESARTLIDALTTEIEGFRAAGATMAELRAGYRAFFDAHPLTTLLPDRDAARHVPPALGRMFRVGTHDSLIAFERLRRAGRLRMGPAPAFVERHARGWTVGLGDRAIEADLVIDATGPAPGALDPFARALVDKGWLAAVPGGIATGPGLEARRPKLRYLSPSVSEIGDEILPFPLYDVCDLARLTDRPVRQEAPCPQ